MRAVAPYLRSYGIGEQKRLLPDTERVPSIRYRCRTVTGVSHTLAPENSDIPFPLLPEAFQKQ